MMYHHGAGHNMWTYCLHLGPWTYEGEHYDLGILVRPNGMYPRGALAVVYGPEPHEYISGDAYMVCKEHDIHRAVREEVIKRYEAQLKGGEE